VVPRPRRSVLNRIMEPLSYEERVRRNEIIRRSYAREAAKYDRSMGFFEQRLFGIEHRQWAASRAQGDTLEVAVGTGLNLPHYPRDIRVVGIDLSPEMLELARLRARGLARDLDLTAGDAHDLPYAAESFDTVVCTYSLCNIPDHGRAVREMARVLRPGGRLILVDHVRSSIRPILWVQKLVEVFSWRFQSETQTRRPLDQVVSAGFEIVERDRMRAGVVERLVASKS
jgi:ubiquinone/menaquinone biosynthesis C-methylase UbiE